MAHPWSDERLYESLRGLRDVVAEVRLQPKIAERLASRHRASAENLLHYVTMRSRDLRSFQNPLAERGLSSLGRSEPCVLATLNAVVRALEGMAGAKKTPVPEAPVDLASGSKALERNARALLGPPTEGRDVRIMVTMPSEAASDPRLAHRFLKAGMNVARINCAHDDPAAWEAMVEHIRAAQRKLNVPCQIAFDLAGPKFRTGKFAPGPAVLRLSPPRDVFGRALADARVRVTAKPEAEAEGEVPTFGMPAEWIAGLKAGQTIGLRDARDAKRMARVESVAEGTAVLLFEDTTYIVPETEFEPGARPTWVPRLASDALLKVGEEFWLVPEDETGQAETRDTEGRVVTPARVPCSAADALVATQPGARVELDDGKISAEVVESSGGKLRLVVTHAKEEGTRLKAEKGVNFPETYLREAALTQKDRDDLEVIARHADMVNLSFVQTPEDIRAVRDRLAELDAPELGIVLKIETERAFRHLPELLLTVMEGKVAGVMIARGDLAVVCGWERLAEVQEEILWLCEAAHMPVIWATQVLETMAKKGKPTRAEITDAAMAIRAECVMLNKGPYIVEAIRTLDDILRRMQAHQQKKRPLLRRLKSWRLA